MTICNEIEKAVDDFLKTNSIPYSASLVCKGYDNDGWECDSWRVTVGTEAYEYFTGTSHRKQVKPMPSPAFKEGTVAYKNWEAVAFKPEPPCAASVLYSLILGARALDTSFEYWCDELGYNSDSITSFDIYRACCENGKALKKTFTYKQLAELGQMLEGY